MNPPFSFIDIPSLEALESDSDSVFSMSRNTLNSDPSCDESTPSSPLSVGEFDYVLYNDFVNGPSPIRQDDKVFFTVKEPEQKLVPLPSYEIIKVEELYLSTISDPRKGKSDLYPEPASGDSKKRKRQIKVHSPMDASLQAGSAFKVEDEDASPFPEYYNLTKEEKSFFKKIKLIQSSSRISPLKDNMYIIEVTHYDKSIEYIRSFRSSIDYKMYFCAVDVFYPILRIKDNVTREVKRRVSPENYYKINIQNKQKTLTFLNFNGLVEVIRYRMDPLSAANTGILDLIKCNELTLELQKYL